MRIDCPSCGAAYQVPETAFQAAASRAVRCVRCSHVWTPEPPRQVSPQAAMDPVVTPLPPPRPAAVDITPPYHPPVARRRANLLVPVLWLLTVLLLGGAVTAAILEREKVIAAWPPSERAYALLGLH